jgi:LytR cell envelope-related transcriptional attenuator
MTGPGSADASRMRIAGIVLLALAGVAAVVGLLTLGGGGPSASNTAAQPSVSPAPLPGAVSASPSPAPPVAPPPASPAPASPAPEGPPVAAAPIVVPDGSGGGDAGRAQGGGSPNATVPVRVLNNSTITGLADRAAGDMRAQGWNVVEVGNYPNGVIPVSTVYYRPGTEEQSAADEVARELGIRAQPRFDGIEQASPGLIVIATSNWGQNAS